MGKRGRKYKTFQLSRGKEPNTRGAWRVGTKVCSRGKEAAYLTYLPQRSRKEQGVIVWKERVGLRAKRERQKSAGERPMSWVQVEKLGEPRKPNQMAEVGQGAWRHVK